MQGVQAFLAAGDVTPVDHPSLGLPDSARQFLVHMKVEGAVRNQVWYHECPWAGREVDLWRGNLWGNDGDERHISKVGACKGIEKGVQRTTCVVLEQSKRQGVYILLPSG